MAAAFMLPALFAACASTDVAPIRSAAFAPDADEAKLWTEAAAVENALGDSELLRDDDEVNTYLTQVATRLLPYMQAGDTTVRIEIVRDPFINAFALPNGAIYVHTGLLAAVENEAQLAVVLGHEMTHFLHRHALRERRSAENRQAVARGVLSVLAIAAAGAAGTPSAAQALMRLGGSVADSIVTAQVKGYSRDLERDADRNGFHAIVAAGYDAREAPTVFEKLKEQEDEAGVTEPFFFGDHPALDERIATARELLRESGTPASGRTGEDEFLDNTGHVLLENAALDIRIRRLTRARHAIERYAAAFPEDPNGAFQFGELERRFGDRETAMGAYRRALALDAQFAAAHRELGLLLHHEGDGPAACASLTRYLELAGDAADRPIIAGYAEEIDDCTR